MKFRRLRTFLLSVIAFCFVVGALRSESYNQPDELKLIHALVKGPPAGIAYSLETLTSPRAIEAEIAALMFELNKIDLKAEPHHTDGWSDFQKAEWPLMAILYTGFAIANHADSHPKFKPVAVRHINWCLDALRTNAMSGFMKPHFGEPWPARGEIAKSSVFLHGHYLYLGVRLRELAGPTKQDRWSALCARALVRDFGKSPLLKSYRDMYFLNDNVPAIAALARYDRAFGVKESAKVVAAFIKRVRQDYLDANTGLLCTYVDSRTLKPMQGPRGIGMAYCCNFLPDIDADFAREQWTKTRKHMIRGLKDVVTRSADRGELKTLVPHGATRALITTTLASLDKGYMVCLEHPDIPQLNLVQRNVADGDSGPVVLGVGTSASGFALGAARRMGDKTVAVGIEKLVRQLGSPHWDRDKLYYRNTFDPVGQAVVLMGKTARKRPSKP